MNYKFAVLFSMNKPHTDNIKSGAKISELRTKPPKLSEPYKAYIYETQKDGGCGKVIGEATAYNEATYRICMGVPVHLIYNGCISKESILKYTDNGRKDLTEIALSDIVIYDKPKEITHFLKLCKCDFDIEKCIGCKNLSYNDLGGECCDRRITRPPQSWCFVESEVTSNEM